MSELATDLLHAVSQLASVQPLPLVRQFELPPQMPTSAGKDSGRKNNFAALVLEDGSVGMTYVALDQALQGLRCSPLLNSIKGMDPLEIASLYLCDTGWQRALGLAAINAISQYALRNNQTLPHSLNYTLKPMPDTLSVLLTSTVIETSGKPSTEDHIGMVGYFGRLVEPLTTMGARVTVIELQEHLVRNEPNLEVTLDTSKLANCNKVIITGTTLLNHTIDNILGYCTNADQILMIGPTASCIPQPLFERGITLMGGYQVTETDRFIDNWRSGKKWRQCGFRYSVSKAEQAGS